MDELTGLKRFLCIPRVSFSPDASLTDDDPLSALSKPTRASWRLDSPAKLLSEAAPATDRAEVDYVTWLSDETSAADWVEPRADGEKQQHFEAASSSDTSFADALDRPSDEMPSASGASSSEHSEKAAAAKRDRLDPLPETAEEFAEPEATALPEEAEALEEPEASTEPEEPEETEETEAMAQLEELEEPEASTQPEELEELEVLTEPDEPEETEASAQHEEPEASEADAQEEELLPAETGVPELDLSEASADEMVAELSDAPREPVVDLNAVDVLEPESRADASASASKPDFESARDYSPSSFAGDTELPEVNGHWFDFSSLLTYFVKACMLLELGN